MKKKLIIILLLFFVNTAFAINNTEFNYENAISSYEKGDINSTKEILYTYMLSDGILDCKGYTLLGEINSIQNKKYGELYNKLASICYNNENGDKQLPIEEINSIIKNKEKGLSGYYIHLFTLIKELNIDGITSIDTLLEYENYIESREGLVVFDFHKEIKVFLMDEYLNNKEYIKYFETLNELGGYYNTESNKYGIIFFDIREIKNIEVYKDYIIKLYGEDYYDFIYSYSKLRFWIRGEDVLNKEIVEKHRNEVTKYHKDNNINFENYDFQKDFISLIDLKLNENLNNIGNTENNAINNKDNVIDTKDNTTNIINTKNGIVLLFLVSLTIFIVYIIKNNNKNKK